MSHIETLRLAKKVKKIAETRIRNPIRDMMNKKIEELTILIGSLEKAIEYNPSSIEETKKQLEKQMDFLNGIDSFKGTGSSKGIKDEAKEKIEEEKRKEKSAAAAKADSAVSTASSSTGPRFLPSWISKLLFLAGVVSATGSENTGGEKATVTGTCLLATTYRADSDSEQNYFITTLPYGENITCGRPWLLCNGVEPTGTNTEVVNGIEGYYQNGDRAKLMQLLRAGDCEGPQHPTTTPAPTPRITPVPGKGTSAIADADRRSTYTMLEVAGGGAFLLLIAAARTRKLAAGAAQTHPPVSCNERLKEMFGNLMRVTNMVAPTAALFINLDQKIPAVIALSTSALRELLEYLAGTPAPPIKDLALRIVMGAAAAALGPNWGSIQGLLFFALQNPPPSPQACIDSKWWQKIVYGLSAAGCGYVIGEPDVTLNNTNSKWFNGKRISWAIIEAIKFLLSLSYLMDRLCINNQLKGIMNESAGITGPKNEIDAIKAVLNEKLNKVGVAKSEGKIKAEKVTEFVKAINRLEIDTEDAIDGILSSELSIDKRLEARAKIIYSLIDGKSVAETQKILKEDENINFDDKKLGVLLGYKDVISRLLDGGSTVAIIVGAMNVLKYLAANGAITKNNTGIPSRDEAAALIFAFTAGAAPNNTRGQSVVNFVTCKTKQGPVEPPDVPRNPLVEGRQPLVPAGADADAATV